MSFPVLFDREADRALPVGEVTGALGDSITVLPVVVALAATTDLGLGAVLAWFGVFQVVWGVRYGLPLSVEPMKALAGLAIAGGLTYPEFAAAGLLAGATLLVLGATGTLSRVSTIVGRPVIRGIQLAVALLLLEAGVGLARSAPTVAAAGLGLAGLVALAGYRRGAALAVLCAGTVAAVATAGFPAPSLPAVAPFPAGGPALTVDAVAGTVGQLAMTVGNAAVATALLCEDYFDRTVSPDRLARSMGTMSLVAVPLGGVPMCHGSGGLAGKYAFGARTGLANLVLGGLYLAAAVAAAGALLAAFPMALLGVLLAVVALQLGRSAADTDAYWLTAVVGVVGLLANVGVAFVVGIGLQAAVERFAAG